MKPRGGNDLLRSSRLTCVFRVRSKRQRRWLFNATLLLAPILSKVIKEATSQTDEGKGKELDLPRQHRNESGRCRGRKMSGEIEADAIRVDQINHDWQTFFQEGVLFG